MDLFHTFVHSYSIPSGFPCLSCLETVERKAIKALQWSISQLIEWASVTLACLYLCLSNGRFLKIHLELEEKDEESRKQNFIEALNYMSRLPLREVGIVCLLMCTASITWSTHGLLEKHSPNSHDVHNVQIPECCWCDVCVRFGKCAVGGAVIASSFCPFLCILQAESYLKKYGNAMVNEIPQETTVLLKQLCTRAPAGEVAWPAECICPSMGFTLCWACVGSYTHPLSCLAVPTYCHHVEGSILVKCMAMYCVHVVQENCW